MPERQREGRGVGLTRRSTGAAPDRRAIGLVSTWMAILVITGSFHLYRGAIADGVIYLAVALLLVLDAVGLLPGHRTISSLRLPRGAVMLASAMVALPLLLAPLHGIIDAFVVGAIGVAALVVAWPDPQRGPSDGRRLTTERPLRRSAVLWSCAGLFFCVWELGAYLLGRLSAAAEYAFPPLSDLIDPLVQSAFGRVLLVAAWLAGGVALLRRGRQP